MSKPTLPANSPDLRESYRIASRDADAAAARLGTGADRIPEDWPWREQFQELATAAAKLAEAVRAYAAKGA